MAALACIPCTAVSSAMMASLGRTRSGTASGTTSPASTRRRFVCVCVCVLQHTNASRDLSCWALLCWQCRSSYLNDV
jgi:hypothetical protein